jgi:hypothetical protein
VLFQEEISSQPLEQARRLYRFLSLDEAHVSPFLNERVNVSATDRSATARKLLRGGAGMLRRVAGDRFVRDLKTHALVKRLREANKQNLQAVIPPLRPETEAQLVRDLADDMADLAGLLGRENLPWPSWQRARERVDA